MNAPQRHPRPDYRLTLDGRDITPAVDARLISLTLTECRGDEADQLDLQLDDGDGALEFPARGVTLSLAIGWAGEPLVDKGTFVVDEAEHSGAPDQITIRARSAELGANLRDRRDQSWHRTTLGAILDEIARRNQLVSRVDARLSGQEVGHIDQTNESDINFVTRLAKRYDAVATVKKRLLVFLPIEGMTTSKGDALPLVTLTRADGDTHRYHTSERDAYSGVRAYWHDPRCANRRSVLVGLSGNAKRLKESYATEADALAAAQAEWRRILRGAATFELTLAIGQALLAPQTPVRVRGFKPQIDNTEWLSVKTAHRLGDGGYTTRAELETSAANESLDATGN
ncbi:contractile injection system protein, VgrG/Pvc8 family [Variovorax sp. YR216]|uniref:contractile injection system protein, VgrG/Pvc8 family n=1 Tax=Variovorax sp. YR216 TaxID=1882828 RepID=UPI00089BA08A|nr:contractile injection system protein, VgrG/Pvc8 family [Variovorax sp. YR216]SEA50219.1 hypothetical protein SAMN05444680_102673 [Variovorax sp. YR216]